MCYLSWCELQVAHDEFQIMGVSLVLAVGTVWLVLKREG